MAENWKVINPNKLKTRRILKEEASSSLSVLKESAFHKAKMGEVFDFFLSHSHIDKEYVTSVSEMLISAGFTVYIDWIVDKNERGEPVTKNNADLIRKRMHQCKRMLYLHTKGASDSKWCPWEIGIFDEFNGEVYVGLIATEESSTTGQEYLDLYNRFYFDGNYWAINLFI